MLFEIEYYNGIAILKNIIFGKNKSKAIQILKNKHHVVKIVNVVELNTSIKIEKRILGNKGKQ